MCYLKTNYPSIPWAYNTAMDFNIPSTVALNGGEDYELLFTIDQKHYDAIRQVEDVSIIGYITDENEGCNFISNDKNQSPLMHKAGMLI